MMVAFAAAVEGCAGSSAGFQKDGSYVLDSSEKGMDCQRLGNSLWGRMQVAKGLPAKAKAELASAAPNAVLAMGRLFGANRGLVAVGEYDRERARVRALHRAVIEKGCPPVDVDRELAESDATIADLRKK